MKTPCSHPAASLLRPSLERDRRQRRVVRCVTVCILLVVLLSVTWACDAGQTDPLAVIAETSATAAPAGSGAKWPLWTGGAHLRGANIYQRRVYPKLDGPDFMGPGPVGPPYTQADFDRLAALGANYVNVSHPGLFTETPPYTLDPTIQANLDQLLVMIAKADMFAVVTFRTGPGRSEFWAFWGEDTASDPQNGWFDASYYNNRVWGDQAAQDAWTAMWRYTAGRYKDSPVVVGYDLMCEPNSNEVGSYPLGDPLDVWDPEEFYATYGGTLYDWNQLYPRITAAIRQVDPDTPLLIGGMAYSAVNWLPYLEPTGDPRTVYTVHQYAPTVYTHQEPPLNNTYPGVFDTDWDGTPDQFNRAWIDSLLSTVDTFTNTHNVPVAANEFGAMRWEPGVAGFMADQMDLFEGRGLNHALWLWETSWPPLQEEVDAFNFRHGPDPDNHTDVPASDLIDVIVGNWRRNTIRLSTLASTPTPTATSVASPTPTLPSTPTATPTPTPTVTLPPGPTATPTGSPPKTPVSVITPNYLPLILKSFPSPPDLAEPATDLLMLEPPCIAGIAGITIWVISPATWRSVCPS